MSDTTVWSDLNDIDDTENNSKVGSITDACLHVYTTLLDNKWTILSINSSSYSQYVTVKPSKIGIRMLNNLTTVSIKLYY